MFNMLDELIVHLEALEEMSLKLPAMDENAAARVILDAEISRTEEMLNAERVFVNSRSGV